MHDWLLGHCLCRGGTDLRVQIKKMVTDAMLEDVTQRGPVSKLQEKAYGHRRVKGLGR